MYHCLAAEVGDEYRFPGTFISPTHQCPGYRALIKGSLDRAFGTVSLPLREIPFGTRSEEAVDANFYYILVHIPEYLTVSHFTVNSFTIS